MAKLALTVAGGVAGAVIGSVVPGLGTALGFELGTLVGGLIAQLVLPGQRTYGPRVTDMNVMSSAPGQPIPLLWGTHRLGGQVIWSTPIQETSKTTSAKGGPTSTTYSYTLDFAAGFCQGPAKVVRIWGDSKLIYNTGAAGANRGAWSAALIYQVNDLVTYQDPSGGKNAPTLTYICMVENVSQSPLNGSYWAVDLADSTNPGSSTYVPIGPPSIYEGTTTQLPDPGIVSFEGADVTPGYRGLCYLAWYTFPLEDFGNRLPNLRAEVTSNGVTAEPMNVIPWPFGAEEPNYVITDALNETAFVFRGGDTESEAQIARVDLSQNAVVASGIIDMTPLNAQNFPIFKDNPHFPDGGWGSPGDIVACADGIAAVDTVTGNIWGFATVGFHPMLVEIDGWTFKAIDFVDLNPNYPDSAGPTNTVGVCAKVLAITPVLINMPVSQSIIPSPTPQAAQPTPGLICFGTNSYAEDESSDGYIMFTVATSAGNAAVVGQFYATFGGGFGPGGMQPSIGNMKVNQTYPVVDQINGNAYFIYGNTETDDWIICRVNLDPEATTDLLAPPNLTGPLYTDCTLFNFPADSSIGVGQAMFWDATNGYLVVMTDAGTLLQIDPGTGAILDQVGSSSEPQFNVVDGVITGSFLNYAGGAVQAAFKGVVQNGQIWVPDLTNPDTTVDIISTNDFALVYSFNAANFLGAPPVPNWPGNEGDSMNSYIYDPVGNDLVCVSSVAQSSDPTTWALYRAYFDRLSTAGVTADIIVEDICALAGMPEGSYNASLLSGIAVQGYAVTQLTTGKDMINTLGQAFFFEGRESDFVLSFVPRGLNPLLTIPEDDLGQAVDMAALTETIGQEQDVPKSVEVLYVDPQSDYQQGQQKLIRHSRTKKTLNQTSISLPIVMTASQAAILAQQIMWTAENERRTYSTNFWKAFYLLLDPCDVIAFNYHGDLLQAHITESTIGFNFASAIKMTSDDQNSYISQETGNNGRFIGQTLTGLAATLLWLLDIPYLSDTDADGAGNTGYYAAMAPSAVGSSWAAGVLYDSVDNETFAQVGSVSSGVPFGTAVNKLAPPQSVFAWDYVNTLTVRMIQGSAPATTTQINVLGGANAVLLYPSLEVLQYQTLVNNGDGTVTLSNLLRGRRGTDDFTGSHTIGEKVLFLSSGGIIHEQVSQSALNIVEYYKPITVGADLNSGQSQGFAITGRDLMPYAPAYTKVYNIGTGLLITWLRRTRLGGALQGGTGYVPLAEASELYSVDILNGAGQVVRTINGIAPPNGTDSWASPSQPNVLYTTAQQTADGFVAGAGWSANVYQISGQVGRGFGTNVTLLPYPGSPPGLISLVAHVAAQDASAFAPTTTTAPIDTTGANFLVMVAVQYDDDPSTNAHVSDSFGNTWVALTKQNSYGVAQIFYAADAITGPGHTFNIDTTVCGGSGASLAVAAFAGVNVTPFEAGSDEQSGQINSPTANAQPGSVTAASVGDLIITGFGGLAWSGPATVDSGFTITDQPSGGGNENAAALAYLITTTAPAVNPKWTVASNPNRIMATIAAFAHS